MTVGGGGGSLKAGIIGSVGVKIFPNLAGFEEELASGIVNATTARALFIGTAMEELGRKVFAKFTIPLAIATAANIAQFQALDREIRTVLTLFGTAPSLIDSTFEALREGVSQVSRDVGGLEKDISDGLYQAISAGVPRGGVFDFLNVAQMAAIADKTADLTTAVDGLTTVVNAFGLEASDVEEISDVMFTTVALGKTTFGELSQSIGRVAPIAASAGVSFQELFAIIGATTLQGLQTSEAISFLRAGITGLLRPTDELRKIFEDVGFASAEAAIPVIGLQAAFQTVVDATEGSTSKLQELIGTSEGVGVILGVTGENAKTFATVLAGVEASTGSTSRAFDIMDQSIGRAFGRMTESFDRLGNVLGELGSELVVPFVKIITNTVTDLGEGFKDLLPLAKALGDVFKAVFEVFELPVIREVIRAFGSLVLTTTALIGLFGGLLFGVGALVVRLAKFVFALTIFKKLRGPITKSGEAMKVWGVKTEKAADSAKGLSKQGARLNTTLGKLGKSVRLVGGAFLSQIGSMLAITVVIGILFNLYTRWQEHNKRLAESTAVFGFQLDKLLENVGAVNNAITFEGLSTGEANIRSFINENIELIRSLRQTKDLLGDEALKTQILAIGASIIWKGNTAEETLEIINQLAQSVGVTIDVEVGDLDTPTDLIDISIAGIQSKVEELSALIQRRIAAGFQGDSPLIQGAIDNLAVQTSQGLAAALQEGRGGEFVKFLGDLEFEPGRSQSNFFTNLRDEFASITGLDLPTLGTLFDPIADVDEFVATILQLGGFDIAEEIRIGDLGNQIDEISEKEFLRSLREGLPGIASGLQNLGDLTEEEQEKLSGLLDTLAGSLAAGREAILAELDLITEGFLAQIPLFDLYEGASDIDFDEWVTSMELITSDMKVIEEFIKSPRFQELPDRIQTMFNDANIDDQTWLAILDPDEFAEALILFDKAIDQGTLTGLFAGQEQKPEIFDKVDAALQTQFDQMKIDAADAGDGVQAAFGTELDQALENWPGIVLGAFQAVNDVINSFQFAKPGTIQGPDFVLGSVSGGDTITVIKIEKVETSNLPEDLATANLVQSTSNLNSGFSGT